MNNVNGDVVDYVEKREPESALENQKLLEVAEYAEKRIAAVNKIKGIVLKVTNVNDWVDQAGKPYLQGSGCHKVANIFGIGWRFIGEPRKVMEEDGHYRYDVPLEVILGNRSIEIVGSRSTKDDFFTTRYRNGKKTTLPTSEIDGGDILKSAITNAQGIGIQTILGIKNMTWEEVKGAGIDRSKTSRIEYGKAQMSPEVKEERDKLGEMLMEMAGDDKELASKMLEEFTAFTAKDGKEVPGKKSLADLSEKAIPVTYGKVKKEYEEWAKDGNKKSKSSSKNSKSKKEQDDEEDLEEDFAEYEKSMEGGK